MKSLMYRIPLLAIASDDYKFQQHQSLIGESMLALADFRMQLKFALTKKGHSTDIDFRTILKVMSIIPLQMFSVF